MNILHTLSSCYIEIVVFHYAGIELDSFTLTFYFNWLYFFRIKELIFEVVKLSFAEAWLDENRRLCCYNWSFNWTLTWNLTLIVWWLWLSLELWACSKILWFLSSRLSIDKVYISKFHWYVVAAVIHVIIWRYNTLT